LGGVSNGSAFFSELIWQSSTLPLLPFIDNGIINEIQTGQRFLLIEATQ
jgi:hypothetical protein